MKPNIIQFIILLFLGVLVSTCYPDQSNSKITSPDGNIWVDFLLSTNGKPQYKVNFKNQTVIDTSGMGFIFKEMNPMKSGFSVLKVEENSFDETWETVWGETKSVRNNYHEAKIYLKENSGEERLLNIIFKVYDEGIGFRYEFPEQKNVSNVIIMSEETNFQLTGDHTAWWIPADYDSYEYLFTESTISEIDAAKYNSIDLASRSIKENNAVNTPLTMKINKGVYVSIHEANLTNYSGMTLRNEGGNLLVSSLVPSKDGSKVKLKAPFKTPWRTIQIADSPTKLIESNLIQNLNEPNKLEDVSWVKPMKYMGIWWGMHLDIYTWHEGPKHGATTKRAKEYIDFAADNKMKGLLIEGWNTGWDKWWGEERDKAFDFVTSTTDFDLEEVTAYAKEKGVDIIGHHETSAAVGTYEKQIDKAFELYNRVGVKAIKTGYVGSIIPEGEYHHGQWMVNHYRNVVEKAAKHKIMLDVHEPIKPTGIRRTYPHMMTREGVRGTEFNAPWGGGNPAVHIVTIPFTRMLAGPIDYTPGIFDLKYERYKVKGQVPTTLANQLAQYVVLYSPLHMAADLPENYEGQPAFQFIKDVPTDWESSKVLNGEIGKYITIVRQERNKNNWYLGSLTNDKSRSLKVPLDFLSDDNEYLATIYADGNKTDWNDNPTAISISKFKVDKSTVLKLNLAGAGGAAISIVGANSKELRNIEEYKY